MLALLVSQGQWVGWTIDEPVTVQVRKTSGNKRRVARGVYKVRFRVLDDAKKTDTRRIVVAKRKNGRFYKKGKFMLENRCPA